MGKYGTMIVALNLFFFFCIFLALRLGDLEIMCAMIPLYWLLLSWAEDIEQGDPSGYLADDQRHTSSDHYRSDRLDDDPISDLDNAETR